MSDNNKINGIVCHVENCTYHEKDNSCIAGSIKVGTTSTCECNEHTCDTFKTKN